MESQRSTGPRGPRPLSTGLLDGVTALSCATTTFCAAVDFDGYAAVLTAGAWTATGPVVGPDEELHNLSCVSASFCVATGDNSGTVYTYVGTGWTPTTTSSKLVGALSCVSPAFCLGVSGTFGVVGTAT